MKKPSVQITGPLVAHVEGVNEELIRLGYTPLSAIVKLRLFAHISRWIQDRKLQPWELTPARVEQFVKERRRAGHTHARSLKGVEPLIVYLRRIGVVPQAPEVVMTEVEQLVEYYCTFLRTERGLSPKSITLYRPIAQQFLVSCFPSGNPVSRRITATNVSSFVIKECRCRTGSHAKMVVSAMRSLLRFLYLQGFTTAPLMSAVPSFASWRVASLPRPVEAEQVVKLLRTCDRQTPAGRRSYAIILLLARLGLRAGVVAAIELGDVDWRSGDILIRGKGRQQERLPLPSDVGEALADYLRHDRPRFKTRSLFLRRFAPIGPITRCVVTHTFHCQLLLRCFDTAARRAPPCTLKSIATHFACCLSRGQGVSHDSASKCTR